MVFSSSVFVFLFLPLFLIVYYLLPFRARSAWILAGSWLFYAWWRVDFLALIVGVSLWTYLLGRRIAALPAGPGRLALALGVAGNLAVLGYFKYFNFGIESLNALLGSLGAARITAWEVVLPVGISFYVFQATSYLVDLHRGDAPEARSYLDLAAYISLFPQLIAGPIIRYKDIAGQLLHREHSFASFSEGSWRFMVGFCKKVLVADTVAVLADAAFALAAPTAADAWLGTAAYAVQIYFDFSGYSDMAIGLGLMMGFRFMENFRAPYLASSITEFWGRWHISLSTWLRDYLYIPLGGNRRGRRRTLVNLMTVMLLGGLWHGAAWTYVLWGAWHGLLLAAERLRSLFAGPAAVRKGGSGVPASSGFSRAPSGLSRLAGVARTMVLVLAGWVLFRSPDLQAAGSMYAGMIGLRGLGLSDTLRWQLSPLALSVLALAVLGMYVMPLLGERLRRGEPHPSGRGAPPEGRLREREGLLRLRRGWAG
ncbi:MAG: MBOAT family protein, partial [Spirochaetales bacterium]|nr:MBOAT family protein [Spirochaetales bacterium]